MKNSKSIRIIFIVLVIFFSNQLFAQKNEANDSMKLAAFTLAKKYPDAQVKNWKSENGVYTAKIIQNGKKRFVTFNKNGDWVMTASKVSVFRKLPDAVETGYKKSDYSGYHVFFVKDIETPADHYYQIMVDDSNHKIDALHQGSITRNWIVEFSANGQFKHAMLADNIQDYLHF